MPFYADPKLLRLIFGNLLSNAYKYSPFNTEVRFAVEATPDAAVITIQDSGIGITPELREQGKRIASEYTKGPLYTTPTEVTPTNKGTWIFPGTGGGPNWNGAAFDPDTHMLYTPLRLKPQYAGIKKGDPKTTNMDYYGGGGGAPINGPQGLPILKPPYSELVATNMDKGDHMWRIPIGDADDVGHARMMTEAARARPASR